MISDSNDNHHSSDHYHSIRYGHKGDESTEMKIWRRRLRHSNLFTLIQSFISINCVAYLLTGWLSIVDNKRYIAGTAPATEPIHL